MTPLKGDAHLANALSNAWRIQQDQMKGTQGSVENMLGDLALVLQQLTAGLREALTQIVNEGH